jgi:uncharacterized membrane protein
MARFLVRAVVVAATTGTGWLDPQAIDAVEYITVHRPSKAGSS